MKMKSLLPSLAYASVLLFALSSATAGTITANHDARIQADGNSTTNYGSANDLFLRNVNSVNANTSKIYLRFDVGSELSSGQSFSDSILNLTFNTAAQSAGTTTFSLYGITNNQSFLESVITWDNAPRNDTTSGTAVLPLGTTLLGTLSIPSTPAGDSVATFSGANISQYLNYKADVIADPYGDGPNTNDAAVFILTSSANNQLYRFYSKEGAGVAQAPNLNFTAVPEPSTTALLVGAGLAGLVLVRRRQRAA